MSRPTSLIRMLSGGLALLLVCATATFAQTPLITDDGAGTLRTDWSGTVGLQFTVGASNITVTELGFWDNSLNGNTIAHSVGIWTDSGTLLGSVSVQSGTASALTGEFRYQPLATAITLTAGVTYRLGAQVANGNADQFHDQATTTVTYSPGATVINSAYSANGTTFVFPNNLIGGASKAFVGPNMKFSTSAPEVNVTGAGLTILDGDTTPQSADNTDFGSADITSGTVQKVFNIQNTGSATLTLANVTTTNSEFGVLTQPALSIAPGGNSNFEIAFNPTAVGTRTATLSFTNNDTAAPSESPYDFAVQGTGTDSAGTVPLITDDGTAALRTDWSGTVGLQFTVGASNLTVTELGFWDNALNGNTITHAVGIWNNTGTLLGSVTVQASTVSPLTGEFRYATLGTPIVLTAGQIYRLGAQVTNANADSFHDAAAGGVAYSTGVTVNNGAYSANPTGFVFPNNLFGGAGRAYVGPNMKFSSAGTPPSTIGWSTKPFKVLEAEDGVFGSGAALLNTSYAAGTPQFEASGRKAVRLTSDTSYVRFTVPAGIGGTDIVGIVVRHSIPDVFSGTTSVGQNGLMSVRINGALRNVIKKETGGTVTANMTISSKFAWNYSSGNTSAASSNTKNTFCGWWFNDNRYVIQGAVAAGDTIELRASVSALTADSFAHPVASGYNGTKYCIVDLIELENVGAPVANPDTNQYLNIMAYGATPNGGSDDVPAIKSALAAAVSQGKAGIYIPAGTFDLNTGANGGTEASIIMPAGKTILGAGVWHTMLTHNRVASGRALSLSSDNKLRDFSHYGTVVSRGPIVYGISGSGVRCVIERIWLERHIGWLSGADDGLVKNCRVKNVVADGISAVHWVDNFTWQENYFRGTSDDCAAIWSGNAQPDNDIDSYKVCTNPRWINNDMICVRWGSGAVGVWGAAGGAVQNNYIADTQRGSGVKFNTSQHTMGTSNFTVSGNKFVRCGNLAPYHNGTIAGAVEFLNWNPFAGGRQFGIVIENNEFISPVSASVYVLGSGQPGDFIFRTNTITNSTVPVLITTSDAKGSAQFNNNTATNFTGGEYLDDNSPNFSFTKTGNIPNNWP